MFFLINKVKRCTYREINISKSLWFEHFLLYLKFYYVDLWNLFRDGFRSHQEHLFLKSAHVEKTFWLWKQECDKLKLFLWYLAKEYGTVARLFIENGRDTFFTKIKLKYFFKVSFQTFHVSTYWQEYLEPWQINMI